MSRNLLLFLLILGLLFFGGCGKKDSSADFEIVQENGQTVLKKYIGSGREITIPDGVTEIGDEAFGVCMSVNSVIIPNGVTKIGNQAFWCCNALTSVQIPGSVTKIGDSAFRDCGALTSVKISEGVKEIGDRVFENCTSLTSLKIPQSVTRIGTGAFTDCKTLTSIEIPESVTEIERKVFSGCPKLTLLVAEDSMGEEYAKKNKYSFKVQKGEIQENLAKLDGSGVNRMKKEIRNQVGAAAPEDMASERANIENNFHNVRLGVRDDTGFLAKFQDENQIIRLFGGSDLTGDYGVQAARAGSTMIMGDLAGMTVERTASLVSETGKLAQQFGLKGDSVQVAGNLATSMVMAAQRQPHTGPIDPNRLQMFASRNAAGIAVSQNSRNLVFLMNENFHEGSKMQKLKEKLLRGEPLDESELKEITVDSLRRDYTGSAENFALHMSDAVYQQRFSSMTEEQQVAYNLNATRAEQNRFRELLNIDAYKGVWKRAITSNSYNGDERDLEQLYAVRNKLLGEIEPDRVAQILSGAEEPTEEEQKKIDALGLTDQVKAIRSRVLDEETFQSDFKAADAALAYLKNPNATINDIDTSMRAPTREDAKIATCAKAIKERFIR